MNFSIKEPFQKSNLGLLWGWLQEYPHANFDDFGPKSYPEFESEMRRRLQTERIWQIETHHPVGIVAYVPYNDRSGVFHGICFAREVHRTGVAQAAVKHILKTLQADGVEKVSAMYFADNANIDHFLMSLGAEHEGVLRRHTVRDGLSTDMRLVAFYL